MITTTCLILWIPTASALGPAVELGVGDGHPVGLHCHVVAVALASIFVTRSSVS